MELDGFAESRAVAVSATQALNPLDLGIGGFCVRKVDQCPLKLWERAILQGYSVFRRVHANSGGIVVGDRHRRTISYEGVE